MKVNAIDIVLNNTHGVYFPGQTVQGHVHLDLNDAIIIKDMRIVMRGKAFVHWTEQPMRGPGESRFREVLHHSATEDYVDCSHSLLGKGVENGTKRELAAGRYTYPFQFQLPGNAPTSFEGQYGRIRYWVKVTIDRSNGNNQSAKKVFTVISPVDLNNDPATSAPVQCQKEKRLCCLCCHSGPLSATLALSHKGFVPGEAIHVHAEVSNMTRRKMTGSSIALMMTEMYHTPKKSRAVTQQVVKVKHGAIKASNTDLWDGETLSIPPLPPSHLQGCGIIDIKYTLELRVDPVGPAFELHVPIEIIIGTVPLHSVVRHHLAFNQLTPPPSPAPPPAGHPLPHRHEPPPYPPAYYPPSHSLQGARPEPQNSTRYNVAHRLGDYVFGHSRTVDEDDDENTRGDTHYTPQYVYYTWAPEDLQQRRQHGVRFTA